MTFLSIEADIETDVSGAGKNVISYDGTGTRVLLPPLTKQARRTGSTRAGVTGARALARWRPRPSRGPARL